VITVDALYAQRPFIKAVQRLGWGVVSVLKQERYEIYQEASALSRGQPPQLGQWEDRPVELREVKDLPLTDPALGAMRVVLAEEHWVEVQQQAGCKVRVPQQSHGRWLATRELDGHGMPVIWRIGHPRWGVENHAFNELTQPHHLTHGRPHHPVAILAWLLILVLGFVLFALCVRVHGKLWRAGRVTLQEVAKQLDRGLERFEELQPLWSG
jgi:hypothetical protein